MPKSAAHSKNAPKSRQVCKAKEDAETNDEPQERSQQVCVCPSCIDTYLADFSSKMKTLQPIIDAVQSPSKEKTDIDRSLHENLHILWIGFFMQLFAPLYEITGILWYLRPLDADETVDSPMLWRTTMKAKVRFDCEFCQNVWTSMMGTAIFSVHLSKEVPGAYMLCFKLLGQQCNKCASKQFQSAIWYPEEVIRVLKYVHWQICDELLLRNVGVPPVYVTVPVPVLPSPPTLVNAQVNVGLKPEQSWGALQNARTACRSVTLTGGRKSQLVKNLLKSRAGRPMRSHNSAQCEACQWGVCSALSTQETQRPKHRVCRSRRRRREAQRAQSTAGQVSAPSEPALEQQQPATPSSLPSPKAESEPGTADTPKRPDLQWNILELCLKNTHSEKVFGSARRAENRRVVIFRSLREESNREGKEKLKGWQSADSVLETTEAFSRLYL